MGQSACAKKSCKNEMKPSRKGHVHLAHETHFFVESVILGTRSFPLLFKPLLLCRRGSDSLTQWMAFQALFFICVTP